MWSRLVRGGSVPSLLLALTAASAPALEPGARVTADSVERAGELLLPGLTMAVRRGMRIEVGAPRPVRWRKAYAEATERNAGQAHLGPDGVLLEYLAGLPFTNLDPGDAQVATKIMWNHAVGPWILDDASSWSIEWQLGKLATDAPMQVEAQERSDAAFSKWMRLIGRTEVPPLPAVPDADQVLNVEVFGPTLPVFIGLNRSGPMLTYRYLDGREDDVWNYTSWDRKVRRLSPAVRYQATGGVVTDLNSGWGFSGPVASYTWRFIGERRMLGVLHARRYPLDSTGSLGSALE